MTLRAASLACGSPVGAGVLVSCSGWPELSAVAGGRESCETRILEKTALTWAPLQRTVAAPEPTGSEPEP